MYLKNTVSDVYNFYNDLHPINQEALKFAGYFFIGDLLRPVNVYIHEQGHALAMQALFENSYPTITLTNYGRAGYASFGFQGPPTLSRLGNIFGENVVYAIVYAAGSLVETASLIGLAAISGTSRAYAMILPSLLSTMQYAISAITIDDFSRHPGHDFYNINRRAPIFYRIITAFILVITGLIAIKALCKFRTEVATWLHNTKVESKAPLFSVKILAQMTMRGTRRMMWLVRKQFAELHKELHEFYRMRRERSREIDRYQVLTAVRQRELSQKDAAEILDITKHQVHNLLTTLNPEERAGLVSKKRGKSSPTFRQLYLPSQAAR